MKYFPINCILWERFQSKIAVFFTYYQLRTFIWSSRTKKIGFINYLSRILTKKKFNKIFKMAPRLAKNCQIKFLFYFSPKLNLMMASRSPSRPCNPPPPRSLAALTQEMKTTLWPTKRLPRLSSSSVMPMQQSPMTQPWWAKAQRVISHSALCQPAWNLSPVKSGQ